MQNKICIGLVAALIIAPFIVGGTAAEAQNEIDDEIVVTTTRSAGLKADNPGNITTLDPRETVSLYPVELVNRAAGVHIHRGSGQEHLTAIRSPVLVGGAGAGSFLYLEDGISMRAPGFANVNALMDAMPSAAARVEVVRGPASALYGSNALHGLVNFISDEIDEIGSTITASYGSYGRHALTGQTAHLHENFAARVSFAATGEEDGYQDETSFAQQKLKLETQWGEAATDYSFSLTGMNLNQETGGYVSSYEDEDIATANPNPDAYRDARATRGYLRITRSLESDATLTLTPYFRSNAMAFLMHFLPTNPVEKNAHDSIGLQASYAAKNAILAYTVGLDVELTQGELSEVQTNPADKYNNYLPGTHYDFDVAAQVVAPYIHAVWALGDNTDLITGVRAEQTNYDYTNNTDDGLQGKLWRPMSQKKDFSDVSPKLGLVQRLGGGQRIFLNLARAARAPQVTDLYRLRDSKKNDDLDPDISDIDSETLDSVELGYRISRAGLFFELTAYMMAKENYHFRDADDNYITNGETEHQGIEFDIDWRISTAWSFNTGLSYAQHEYAFDNNLENSRNHKTETITKGNKIDGAPETLAQAALTYRPTQRLAIGLDWQHVGAYFMDAANTTEYEGHDLVDARLTYRTGDDIEGRKLAFTVQNLSDEAYAKRADLWFGNKRYFAGEGRRFSVSFTQSF